MRTYRAVFVALLVCVLPAALLLVNAEGAGRKKPDGRETGEKAKPLLLSDDEPPLTLDDAEGTDPADASGADNSRCRVCHLNIAMEEMAVTHAKENIGCAKCHGNCDAHIDDESWASNGPGTPPQIMYPADKVDSACRECHDTHDASPKKVLEVWRQRCPEKSDVASIVCTDCHGKHRLNPKLRKAWWDKTTGKPYRPAPINRSETADQ